MPYSQGGVNKFGIVETLLTTNSPIKQFHPQLMRFGGNDAEIHLSTYSCSWPNSMPTTELCKFCVYAHQNGFVPMVQVPILAAFDFTSWNSSLSMQGNINAVLNSTYEFAIKSRITHLYNTHGVYHFSIGNEPDRWSAISGWTHGNADALTIHDYIVKVSNWIRDVVPNAIIIGPELSECRCYATNDLSDLLLKTTQSSNISGTSQVHAGRNYIDTYSFHRYPFNGTSTQSRANVSADAMAFQNQLNTHLTGWLSLSSNSNLHPSLTEYNIDFSNPPTGNVNCVSPDYACNEQIGTGPNSFIAGQWMADTYLSNVGTMEFMIPWSIHESSGDPSQARDLGILGGSTGNLKRSTYQHLKMLGDDFDFGILSGSFQSGTSVPDINCYAVFNCTGQAYIIINYGSTPLSYAISNDGNTGTASYQANVTRPNADWVAMMVQGNIGVEETQVIIYDMCGKLRKKLIYNRSSHYSNGTYADPQAVTTKTAFCGCKNVYPPPGPNGQMRTMCADNPNVDTGDLIGNLTLSANTKLERQYWVTGTITVPSTKTLTIDSCELSFGTSGKIVVENGGKLIITNSYLHGCQEQTWKGIEVTGQNTSLVQLYMSNSWLEGADTLIKTLSTNNPLIERCTLKKCSTAIKLNNCQGFEIKESDFSECNAAIRTYNCDNAQSSISKNFFNNISYCLNSKNDNHNSLVVNCNSFVNYSQYAIYADNSTFSNFGTTSEGPGNVFAPTSTLTNSQIRHNGNAVNYYCDPGESFSLSISSCHSVTTLTASTDGTCQPGLSRQSFVFTDLQTTTKIEEHLISYPNPSNGAVTIEYSTDAISHPNIWIFNYHGMLIKRIMTSSNSGVEKVDFSGLSKGIYFVVLDNGAKRYTNKLLISD
jgi:hypothetical protein